MEWSEHKFELRPGYYHFAEQVPFRPLRFRRAAKKRGLKTQTISPRGAEILMRVSRPGVGIAVEFGPLGLPHFHVSRDGIVREQPHPYTLVSTVNEPTTPVDARGCWCGCDRVLERKQQRAAVRALEIHMNVAHLEKARALIEALMPSPKEHADFRDTGKALEVELLAVAHGEWDPHYIDDGRLEAWEATANGVLEICLSVMHAAAVPGNDVDVERHL